MRCTPASYAKAFGRKKVRAPRLSEEPGVGTKLRINWDALKDSRGLPVELAGTPARIAGDIIKLTDFYGLDVRQVQCGFHGRGIDRPSLYVLAGEWFGRVYVDYIAERIEEKTQ